MLSRRTSSVAGFGLFLALSPACSGDSGGGDVVTGGAASITGGSAGKASAGSAGKANGGTAGGTGGQPAASGGQATGAGAGGTTSGGGNPDGGREPAPARGGALNGGAPDGSADDGAAGDPVGDTEPGSGGKTGDVDPFGITELYPSASPESGWTSEHWSAGPYEIDGRRDAHDPLGLSGMRGEGSLEVNAAGELVMSGSQPRIYVYPGSGGPWQNVELTVYYRRVEDAATAYAGLVIGVRSGEDGHTDSNACDAHTYYSRLRHDGAVDFEKELEHPASSTQSRVNPQTVWPPDGELPVDSWIGWKFVIYNLPSGDAVRLEAYRDLTGGEDGGDWVLVNQTVDDGGWSVETDCSEYDPTGGESDRVVLDGGVAFIRNTDVTEARYKWFTVREIDAD